MSNETNNKPSHIVYISMGKSKTTGKDILSKAGAMWPHKTGNGFNLKLKSQSTNGEYIVFEYQDKPATTPSPDDSQDYSDDIPF